MNEYPQVGEPRVGQKTSTIAEPEEAPLRAARLQFVTLTAILIREELWFVVLAVNLPVVTMGDGTLPEIVDDNRSRIAFTRDPSKWCTSFSK
jgi:hypothetical protein